jgi:preprotein translocase subunit SecF
MAFISIPQNLNIPFIKYRLMPLFLMVAMICAVGWGYMQKGINLGVDFKGGILIEAKLKTMPDLNLLRTHLKQELSQECAIQELGKGEKTILIRTEKNDDNAKLIQKIQNFLGKDAVFQKTESIGPKVGQELMRDSFYAIFWALLFILGYVWIRFEWRFGICAMMALIHDCIAVLGFFIFFQKEFSEASIVAILITAAYSINDTVIIFDRIREKRTYQKSTAFHLLLNESLNETLSRTILTSATTLLALWILYQFGGEVISAFSLPILIGIGVGTYSSLLIAAPLLWLFQKSPSSTPKNAPSHHA